MFLRPLYLSITLPPQVTTASKTSIPQNPRNPKQGRLVMATPLPISPPTTTLRSPEITTNKVRFNSKLPFTPLMRGRLFASSAPISSDIASSESSKPEIELEFLGPKEVDPVQRVRVTSGEKVLRNIMLDDKIELYATYGKLMNCGGGGTCGTCIVEIRDGKDLLSERTTAELQHLKKKPESWRLACQTIVGNKENSGKVVVQRMPQWKKK